MRTAPMPSATKWRRKPRISCRPRESSMEVGSSRTRRAGLKPKSYVVLHAGTDYLILGILEKESHPRVNIKAQGRVCSGEPLDANLTLTWNQQTIGQSGQSALT